MPERRIFVPFYNNIFPLIFMLLTDTKKLGWQSIKFDVINRRWCYIIWCISIKSNRPTGYLQILMHEYLYTFQLFDIKRKYLFKMMAFDKQLNNILSTEFVILNVCWWRNLVYHMWHYMLDAKHSCFTLLCSLRTSVPTRIRSKKTEKRTQTRIMIDLFSLRNKRIIISYKLLVTSLQSIHSRSSQHLYENVLFIYSINHACIYGVVRYRII